MCPLMPGDVWVHAGLLVLLGGSRKLWDLLSGSLQTSRGSNTTAWHPAGSRATARGGDFPLELIHGLSPFQGLNPSL